MRKLLSAYLQYCWSKMVSSWPAMTISHHGAEVLVAHKHNNEISTTVWSDGPTLMVMELLTPPRRRRWHRAKTDPILVYFLLL